MTVRNLFNIVLKILGILFLKQTIDLLPNFIQFVEYFKYYSKSFGQHSESSNSEFIWTTLTLFIMLLVYLSCTYLLIFRSNYLIHKFKLTSGFDQEIIPIDANRKTIVGISVILIGGLLLIDSIPLLLKQVYNYDLWLKVTHGMAAKNPDTPYFILYGAKIIIGLLLMGEQRRITNLICKYTDRETDKERIDNNQEGQS